jgi:hypothetical protein
MTSELHAAATPLPIDYYEDAARWAETATFDPSDPTVERGEAAAASGRALLEAARNADEQLPTADDYEAAARWAETATIDARVVETGLAAAESGRALLRAARAGRPALDVQNEPGQSSPVRRFRLPVTLNAELDNFVEASRARGHDTTPSDVMRTALAEYLRAHPAS